MGNKSSTSKNEDSVIIGRITGGLGNQLFVIAATYAYARKYDKKFYITNYTDCKDITYWDNILSYLKKDVRLVFNQQIKNTNIYKYTDINYKEIPNFDKHTVLEGYFQSEKYFKDYKKEIVKLLSLPEYYKKAAELKVAKFNDETIVAVHIRRGDYLKYSNTYHILSKNYYDNAKQALENKLRFRPIYLYFTNDKKWVKENFTLENKDEIIELDRDFKEFAVMQQCHHFITANSSFSWWAAYLSDVLEGVLPKYIIAPKNWYNTKTKLNKDDIYPEGWMVIKDYCEGNFEGSGNANTLNLETETWRDDIIVDSSMKFKRHLNEDKGILFINENINLIYEDKEICIVSKNLAENSINLETFIQNQNSYIESKINMNNQGKKYDAYIINLKSREDRRNIFLNNIKNYDVNVNFFEAVEHKKGFLGCSLSHLYLVQYAKKNNLPYIIVMEDDAKILIDNEKFVSLMEILINNLDKWQIFNACPLFWDKRNSLNELSMIESFNENLIDCNWGQSTSFMVYNFNSYNKFLEYSFEEHIDQYISKNFIQTIYKNKPFSIQINSASDVRNVKIDKNFEKIFGEQYNIIKSKEIVKRKSIGVYSIFVGKYDVFYENFIKNIDENFYPGFTKYYYIVSDNKDLPKFNDRTFIINTEKIGWPYETLYRFKYMSLFNQEDISKSDYIFFMNSNTKFINKIYSDMINKDYTFSIHHGYVNKQYKNLPYEKNNSKSTAYIPYENKFKFEYFGGRFYGAATDKFMNMCKILSDNVLQDEKNNYIAVWHDESHLNKFVIQLIKNKERLYKIDISFHIPEEIMFKFKNINVIYLDKKNYIKQTEDVKSMTNGKLNINGKIIPNKYNNFLSF